MLDHFAIFNVGGLVLWSQTWAKFTGNPINVLIKNLFFEVEGNL
jgi:hypothetical protein